MPIKTHVAAPGSTNFERLTATPAQEGFVSICARTEPTGLVVVPCALSAVDLSGMSGQKKWPAGRMSTHPHPPTHLPTHQPAMCNSTALRTAAAGEYDTQCGLLYRAGISIF